MELVLSLLLVSPYVKKVYGVEIVKEGIIDANYNKKINNIDNVSSFVWMPRIS